MRKNKTTGIYCIENLTNHKIYIGQSVCIEDRWSKHLSALRRNCNDNRDLQKDWNNYGESSFSFRIIEICTKEQLDDKESFYVEQFKSNDKNFGYNFTDGGKKGFKHNPELLKFESEVQKKKYEDNPELRKLRKINAINQWSNPEVKSKIVGENNGMYGKTHTLEARQKISDKAKGKISWRRTTIPVLCVELNRVYPCGVDACIGVGINKCLASNIYDVCKGKRKTCGGYTWKYAK